MSCFERLTHFFFFKVFISDTLHSNISCVGNYYFYVLHDSFFWGILTVNAHIFFLAALDALIRMSSVLAILSERLIPLTYLWLE